MGAFIGDAMALGPHWYYDLDELKRSYGDWITEYTEPKPGHYHAGLAAGASSQAGMILALTLRSLVDCDEYDEVDFCRRLDTELFPQLDGTPTAGPGGYTSQSIRETWRKRQQGLPWGEVAGLADNTEAAERVLAIAVRYADDPAELARHVSRNVALTQRDPTVAAMTVAYAVILGQLVNGMPLDGHLSGHLMELVKNGSLPFHSVTADNLQVPSNAQAPLLAGQFASPDALLTVSSIARAAHDPRRCSCTVYHQFPAAYYLAARFQGDVEQGILNAVNAGGQNQARAILTGALCGAIGGLEAIPTRFIRGLQQSADYMQLSEALARRA
ncbi:MAG: ADP-ribosylglycohydrolase family protein [Rhodanobacter sp.]